MLDAGLGFLIRHILKDVYILIFLQEVFNYFHVVIF